MGAWCTTKDVQVVYEKQFDHLHQTCGQFGCDFLKWYVNDVKLTIDLKLSSYMEDLKFIKNSFIFIIFTSKNDKVEIFTSVRNKLKNEKIWSGLLEDINNLHSIESNGSRMDESSIKDGKMY